MPTLCKMRWSWMICFYSPHFALYVVENQLSSRQKDILFIFSGGYLKNMYKTSIFLSRNNLFVPFL